MGVIFDREVAILHNRDLTVLPNLNLNLRELTLRRAPTTTNRAN